MSSLYEVLGVAPDADPNTVRRAYLRAARTSHPDTGGDAETFAAIAAAWEVLSSPEARARYDAELSGDDPGWGTEDDAPPGTPAPAPTWTGADREDPREPPGPIGGPDPFTSPPLALPVQPPGFDAAAGRRRATIVIGMGLTLLAVLTASGVHQVVESTDTGPLETLSWLCFAWVAAVAARWAQHRRRGLGSVAWWAVAALTVVAGGREAATLVEAGGPAAGRVGQLAAIAVVVSGWLVVSWQLPRRFDRSHERQARAAQVALAHLWNHVLAAAQPAGRRLVRAETISDRDGRVQVHDVRTGEVALLVLAPFLWGGFLVLSDAGVVARAPATAPAAWSALLTGPTGHRR